MNILIEDRQAALNPNESFIVQAPAGSGKTELLIQRYLKLLACANKAPEEIIAITFTRKAAGEMRARLLLALKEGTQEKPKASHKQITWELAKAALQKDQTLGWHLQDNPSRMRILTIDALAQNLCQQIPLTSGFGSQPSPTEDSRTYYEKAVNQLFNEIDTPGEIQAALATLLSHLDNRQSQLSQLLIAMLANRDQWLPYLVGHDTSQLKIHLENNLGHITTEALTYLESQLPAPLLEQIIPLAQFAAEQLHLANKESPISACQTLSSETTFSIDNKKQWLALTDLLLTDKLEWRKGVNKNTGFPAESKAPKEAMKDLLKNLANHPELLQALCRLKNAPPADYSCAQWQVVEALLVILPMLVAHLQIVFQESNEVDFTELSLGALRALGSDDEPTELSMVLDYQIQHILIDEFQDTSHTHFRLLEQLIREWQPNDGHSLFLVGDPMQSIYRFRHAEVKLFIKALQSGIGNISLKTLILNYNFRSNSNIIDWVNELFTRICPPTNQDYQIEYSPSVATLQEQKQQRIFYYPHIKTSTDKTSQRQAEAQNVLSIIQKIREDKPTDSIAILVKARSHLGDILPTLKANDIGVTAIDIELLAKQPGIMDLTTLTLALNNQADRVHWFALLRAPWCGLELDDLLAIAQAAKQCTIYHAIKEPELIEKLSDHGKQRLIYLSDIITNAIEQSGRQPFAQWVEQTWLQLGGNKLLVSASELEYAEQFFQLLENIDSRSGQIAASQLEDKLARTYPNITDEQSHAVNVMTIHKSKGLEFDHVILPRLDAGSPPANSPLLRWSEHTTDNGNSELIIAPIKASEESSDKHSGWLRQQEQKQQQDEYARLFYVASTRAKNSLHLLANINYDSSKKEHKTPKRDTLLSFVWPAFKQICQQNHIDREANAQTQAPLAATENTLKRLTLDYISQSKFQPTQPVVQSSKNTYQAISLQQQLAKLRGIIIHSSLEQLSTAPIEHWQLEKLLEPQALWTIQLQSLAGSNKALVDNELAYIRSALENIFHDPQAKWILNQKHKEARSEYPLTTYIKGNAIDLILDRTFIDEKGTRWIIDYKTTSDEDITPHIAQLEQYAKAIRLIDERPIMLGIYFPASQLFEKWAFSDSTQSPQSTDKETLT